MMGLSRVTLLSVVALGVAIAGCGQDTAKTGAAPDPESPNAAPAMAASPAAATPADVVIGTEPILPTGRPALDTLGVSLGQPLDGARAAFKAAGASSNLTYYKETLNGLPGGASGRFISGLFAQNQPKAGVANESLGALLTGPPLTPQVWYVGRAMSYPREVRPAAPAVLKALTDKYGPPQRVEAPSAYFWSWDATGAPTGAPAACFTYAQIGSQIAGTVTNPATGGIPSVTPPPAACARVVQARLSGLDDLVSEMEIGLTDTDLMWKGLQRTLAAANDQAARAKQDALKSAEGNTPKL